MTDPKTGRPTITYPGPCGVPGCDHDGAWVFSDGGHVFAIAYVPPTDPERAKTWSPPPIGRSRCLAHLNTP